MQLAVRPAISATRFVWAGSVPWPRTLVLPLTILSAGLGASKSRMPRTQPSGSGRIGEAIGPWSAICWSKSEDAPSVSVHRGALTTAVEGSGDREYRRAARDEIDPAGDSERWVGYRNELTDPGECR